MDKVDTFFMGAIVGTFIIGIIFFKACDLEEKGICQKDLPRNVECVWAPPKEQE